MSSLVLNAEHLKRFFPGEILFWLESDSKQKGTTRRDTVEFFDEGENGCIRLEFGKSVRHYFIPDAIADDQVSGHLSATSPWKLTIKKVK